MSWQRTMTEDEEREWVRRAQSGELRAELSHPGAGSNREAFAAKVREEAVRRYPDRVVPWGGVAELADRAGCTRSWAARVLKSAGFTFAWVPAALR